MEFDELRLLRQTLTAAQWVSEELETTITRQAKTSAPSMGGHSSETPLPFNDKASEAKQLLEETMSAWCRGDDFGVAIDNIMSYKDEPVDMLHELSYAVEIARAAIDTPPVVIYLGDCVCGSRLYGDPDAPELACEACALIHRPKQLRLINQRKGYDLVVTAREAGRYLGEVYGIPVTTNRIQVWASRGKLKALNEFGPNIFRLGDIIELARVMGAGK